MNHKNIPKIYMTDLQQLQYCQLMKFTTASFTTQEAHYPVMCCIILSSEISHSKTSIKLCSL